jgi:hypothetical protein
MQSDHGYCRLYVARVVMAKQSGAPELKARRLAMADKCSRRAAEQGERSSSGGAWNPAKFAGLRRVLALRFGLASDDVTWFALRLRAQPHHDVPSLRFEAIVGKVVDVLAYFEFTHDFAAPDIFGRLRSDFLRDNRCRSAVCALFHVGCLYNRYAYTWRDGGRQP